MRESEQVRGQLESQNQELLATRTKQQTEITEKTTALKEAIAAANNAAKVLEKTQEENTALRNEIRPSRRLATTHMLTWSPGKMTWLRRRENGAGTKRATSSSWLSWLNTAW